MTFVGQSGAGKSTIVSLFTRMCEYDCGDILTNSVPRDEMDIESWRDRISVVRQNPYIFENTLEYNLTIGNRDASRAEIERICEIARINKFIDDLPNGYDTLPGGDGVQLSGGQKQRVAIARTLLDLDKATSDFNSNLEKDIQQCIKEMNRKYAIIAIAHRLSTVENADSIYTLKQGEIIEAGPHDELIKNDGTYADLYTI